MNRLKWLAGLNKVEENNLLKMSDRERYETNNKIFARQKYEQT